MIRKLKVKFIILSMSSLLLLLTAIVVAMNVVNYNSLVEEADAILSFLVQGKGTFPDFNERPNGKFPLHLSPETPYESRYFTVFYDQQDQIVNVDLSKIATIDTASATELAKRALDKRTAYGFVDIYRYAIYEDFNGMHITFLDCGRKLDFFRLFLLSSISMSILGYGIVFFIIVIMAEKIIRPIAESYEKQRQFITNAGHEIKTPLTIIHANVDLLEMELGSDQESLADIKEQVYHLKTLTEDLIFLAKMEEAKPSLEKMEFPLSEVVCESIHSFQNLALTQQKEFICDIEPMLAFNGNDRAIRQLLSLLLDNALKYSTPQDKITVTLKKQNRNLLLSVSNQTESAIKKEQLPHIFERFYRLEDSHNSKTGGHGIGLSIAKAIVAAHDGKITAIAPNQNTFVVTVTFPI